MGLETSISFPQPSFNNRSDFPEVFCQNTRCSMEVFALNPDVEIMILGEAYSLVIKINSKTFEKVEIFGQTGG